MSNFSLVKLMMDTPVCGEGFVTCINASYEYIKVDILNTFIENNVSITNDIIDGVIGVIEDVYDRIFYNEITTEHEYTKYFNDLDKITENIINNTNKMIKNNEE